MNCFIDIETTGVIPDEWNANPTALPIACIGIKVDEVETVVYSNTHTGDAMTDKQVMDVVEKLLEYNRLNCKVVSFNGSGFDLKLLAQYAEKYGKYKDVHELNRNHIDIMFVAVCERGHPIALAKMCEAMNVGKKTLEGGGLQSVKLWEEKQYERVLEYNKQDVELLANLYKKIAKTNTIEFLSKAGNRIRFAVQLHTVKEGLALPPLERELVPRTRFVW